MRKQKQMCDIFHCDRRGDMYCCYYCPKKNTCRNPCLNNPEKCGQMNINEKRKGATKE